MPEADSVDGAMTLTPVSSTTAGIDFATLWKTTGPRGQVPFHHP
jgi:hypothetical protein